MSTAEIIDQTEAFIRENFLYTRPDLDLPPDLRLLGSGIIDSMGVMELIEFLQERFRIAIRDEEITEENLGSLAAIADLVKRRREAADGLYAA